MTYKPLTTMTDSEYLYDLVQMFNNSPSGDMKGHAERLNLIRTRFEDMERLVYFNIRSKSIGRNALVYEATHKPTIHHHSPVPTPHILG